MGRLFHGAHTHGRAFHGEKAREMLAMHRRDSHGNKVVMNVPAELDNKANFIHNHPSLRMNNNAKAEVVETAVNVVYVTTDAPPPAATTASNSDAKEDAAAAYMSAKAAAGQPHVQSSAAPTVVASSSTSLKTVPEPRTRSAQTSKSLQTAPPQVSYAIAAIKLQHARDAY